MKKLSLLLIALVLLLSLLNGCLMMRKSDSRAISQFHKKGITLLTRTLHIRGHSLHYVSVGPDTMRTIIFVHGSPGSWDAFQRYLQDSTLRSRFRLISIDRPGFGYSDFGHALPLQEGCDIISAFIDSIYTGRPIYLAGHSLGGSIVPILAADNPQKIKGIVIIAGALDPALEPRERWLHTMTKAPFRYLVPGAFRPANDESLYFKSDVLQLKEKLQLVVCPVHIIHASDDMIVDVRNVDYMKRVMTGTSVTDTILPHGNHFILWNHSGYIIDFLRGL